MNDFYTKITTLSWVNYFKVVNYILTTFQLLCHSDKDSVQKQVGPRKLQAQCKTNSQIKHYKI